MVTILQIPPISQKMFYITLATISIIGLILALLQLRKIRKAQKELETLTNETTQRKRDLVRKDLKSQGIKSDLILSHDFPDSTTQNRYISNISGSYKYNIKEKIRDFESTTEFKKIQKSISAIENRERKLERKEDKYNMNEQEFKRRINKFYLD
ncbi:MAG: hypothetical protein PHY59_03355 [Methanobacterium sp.]|nr:hypothetical protein [Methanobacterium sp.]